MKVVHIINSLNLGGAEKLLVESIPFYQEKIDIDVITLLDKDTSLKEELSEINKGKLISLTKRSIYNPFIIIKLINLLKGYNLVHAHLFPTLYWVILAKLIGRLDLKIIYTEHSTNNRRRGNKIFRFLDSFIYSKIDKIVTIAKEVDLELKRHLLFKNFNNISIINNGVNLKKIQNTIPFSKTNIFKKDDIVIMQVSSFRYPKDQKTLIKALPFMQKDIKLLLIGDGPLVYECKTLADKLSLKDRVIFLGERNDVPKLLHLADIIVLSSEYEGLSLSSIEGMCLNKPFVATDVPGLREVVKNYGLLFELGNYKMFAELIERLLNDNELYQTVARRCKERSMEFSIEKMVDDYVKLYHETQINKNNNCSNFFKGFIKRTVKFYD